MAPHVATPVVLVIDPPAQSSVLAEERAVAPPVLSRPPVGNPVQALSVQPNTAPCQKGGVEQRIVRDKESATSSAILELRRANLKTRGPRLK